jgi:hypothetical protein
MVGISIGHEEEYGNISSFPGEKEGNISTLMSTATSLLSTTSTL